MRIIFIFFFVANFTIASFAQNKVSNNYDFADTLSKDEITDLQKDFRTTSFGYRMLADSCSKKGDSIDASNFFLKIDPYILFIQQITPASIDSYILSNFKITKKARQQYSMLFTKKYNAVKSPEYTIFKRMYDEDQQVRGKRTKCHDSLCKSLLNEENRVTDSVHFNFLYNYIRTKGWPSLSNGSLYASILAIHDDVHHFEYIPFLKEAVKKGNTEIGVLKLIVYWNGQMGDSLRMHRYLEHRKYREFDISCIYKGEFPELGEIKKTIQAHCPIKLFVVSKNSNYRKQRGECFLFENDKLLVEVNQSLASVYCGSNAVLRAMQQGFWQVICEVGGNDTGQLLLYVVFAGENADTPDLDKLKTEGKFVTHAILFDKNKSVILPESIDFIKKLSDWLKKNPEVKLEIDGHTDNDGDAGVNMKLSQSRADEVRKQLGSYGIDKKRLISKGCGAMKPVQSNATTEGKAENRRVEFIVLSPL